MVMVNSDTPVREFPEQAERVESGVIQFEGDWPGIFLRGDYAITVGYQIIVLCRLIEENKTLPKSALGNIRALGELLRSCHAGRLNYFKCSACGATTEPS